jgi:integrase
VAHLARLQEAGLRKITCHMLRHTFASHLVMTACRSTQCKS